MKKQGLDYNKLRVRFKEELSKLTEEEIKEWLEKDEKRIASETTLEVKKPEKDLISHK